MRAYICVILMINLTKAGLKLSNTLPISIYIETEVCWWLFSKNSAQSAAPDPKEALAGTC